MSRIERAAIAVAFINTVNTLLGHPSPVFAQESDPHDRTQYPYSEEGNLRIWRFPDRANTKITIDRTCTFGFLNVTWERDPLEEGEVDSLSIRTDGVYGQESYSWALELTMNAARDFNANIRLGSTLPGQSNGILDRNRTSGFGSMIFLDDENIFCASSE